jgi:hypothetical protein
MKIKIPQKKIRISHTPSVLEARKAKVPQAAKLAKEAATHQSTVVAAKKKTTASANASPAEKVGIALRLPVQLLERIDDAVAGREIPTSRNTWLLEAAVEKLKTEK